MYYDFCGINFGTTNSDVQYYLQKNNSELIDFNSSCTIPTAIYFPEYGDKTP